MWGCGYYSRTTPAHSQMENRFNFTSTRTTLWNFNSIRFATKTELMYRQQFSCLRNSRRTSGRYYICKESEHSTLFTLVLVIHSRKGSVFFLIITKTELMYTHKTVLCVCVQPLKSLGDCFQASIMERE